MKTEEQKSKVNDKNIEGGNVDNLIKTLRIGLSDISRSIKTSEEKAEKFFMNYNKTTLTYPYKGSSNEVKSKTDGKNIFMKDLNKYNEDLNSEINVFKTEFPLKLENSIPIRQHTHKNIKADIDRNNNATTENYKYLSEKVLSSFELA